MRAVGFEPYPTRTEVNMTTAEAIRRFEAAEAAGDPETLTAILGGRIRRDTPDGQTGIRTH